MNALKAWGFSDILTSTGYSSKTPALPGTRGYEKHHDHMHLQKFNLPVGIYQNHLPNSATIRRYLYRAFEKK